MLKLDQNKQLAQVLTGTTLNVYMIAKQMFDMKFTDADFEALERDARIFRCIECNEWQDIEERSSIDICQDCCSEIEDE